MSDGPTGELLRNDFVAEPLGLVDVKGKGAVETWRLVGPVELRGPAHREDVVRDGARG